MNRLTGLLLRLSRAFRHRRFDRAMAAEMRDHLEQETARRIAAGEDPATARRRAAAAFGSVDARTEEVRDRRFGHVLEQTGQDLLYAARQLIRQRGFAAVAILSLALGIGANTAIFSLVDEVLLKTLPVRDPEALVRFEWLQGPQGFPVPVSGNWTMDPETGKQSCTSFAEDAFTRFRDYNDTLAAVFAFAPLRSPIVIVNGIAEVSTHGGQFVSGDYFTGLDVPARIGRLLTPDDDRADAPPVTVISHGFWQRRFGGDPAVLGQQITINQAPVTIVGVTPPGFQGALDVGEAPDFSIPLAMMPQIDADFVKLQQQIGSLWWMHVMGRLQPGVTAGQARDNLAGIFAEHARDELARRPARAGGPPELPELKLAPGDRGLDAGRQRFRERLMILTGFVSLVLLVACANLANLLLARGAARRREIAARLALGASRGRIIRQLLTESGLLVALGGLGGVAFAWWGKQVLLAMNLITAEGPQSLEFSAALDGRVLAFTAAIALGTGLLFGLVPALRATRIDLNLDLQSGSRHGDGGTRSRLARGLMVVQIALSVVLLVGAGLFARTLRNLEGIDVGFDQSRLLLFRLDAKPPAYDETQAVTLHAAIAEHIAALPGVSSTTFSRMPVLSRAGWGNNLALEGRAGGDTFALINGVDPAFFTTFGIPILLGRDFTARDEVGTPRVALINETLARRYFPEGNPVGRHLRLGRQGPEEAAEIIGIVRDAKYTEARNEIQPTVYFPFAQAPAGEANFAVRLRNGDPAAIVGSVREIVRTLDPTLPIADIRTQIEQTASLSATERLFARLSSFFGGLASALVCIGLYGLVSYSVVRRARELGVRMALGAQPARLLQMVLGDSLRLVGLGIVLGLAAAAGAVRWVDSLLYGVPPLDFGVFSAVAGTFLGVAALACFLPARRAARVDPITALRSE